MAAIGTSTVLSNSLWQIVTTCLNAMRPRQWTKNLVAYAPVIFSGNAHQPELFLNATMSVLSFCLISSGVYVFNDLVDVEKDKKHPKKCSRPIASGRLSINIAWILSCSCTLLGLLLAGSVRGALILTMVTYLAIAVSYSLVLKNVVILDLLVIATGFLLRVGAGAVAVGVPASGWLLLSTGLGAVFFAMEKRRQELNTLGAAAADCRSSLRAYSIPLIDRLETLLLPSVLVSYCLYSFLSSHGQWMMLSIPFVLYGIMRYLQLSHSESICTDQPEEILLRDRPIQITISLWLLSCVLVVYGVVQSLSSSLVQMADGIFR